MGLSEAKFLAARNYAHNRGWEFTIISEQELVTSYLKNIVFLSGYRSYPVSEVDQNLILNTLEDSASSTPESLFQGITNDKKEIMRLIPVLWKLVANFEIYVDLEAPLTMHSFIEKKLSHKEERYERIYSLCTGRIGNARWRALRYYS